MMQADNACQLERTLLKRTKDYMTKPATLFPLMSTVFSVLSMSINRISIACRMIEGCSTVQGLDDFTAVLHLPIVAKP